MIAVVLTCDKYRALTEHMIYQYNRLWPNHDFRFRIPYQRNRGADTPQRQFIQSPPSIKETVLTLLDGLNDREWIYWAIDDKYPIALNLRRVQRLQDWLLIQEAINGVLFCRSRDLWNQAFLTGVKIEDSEGHLYLERRSYEQIWIHQFIRVSVLKRLFLAFPDSIAEAADMDDLKNADTVPKPEKLFVVRDNLAVFGESTRRQKLTQNCYESILQHGLLLPDWFDGTTGTFVTMGRLNKDRVASRAELAGQIPPGIHRDER
jgi:hypothetical protein